MKAILVWFDSLSRNALGPYGAVGAHTPNFDRLAAGGVTFDKHYVGSMPCIPARRELHTGRYNFLHRGWGPLEPFDDSMPALLSRHGVYTHLVSDHYHYWEDGGCTYHNRYNSWECVRGQEGDPWKGEVTDPELPSPALGCVQRQDLVNRRYLRGEAGATQTRTFDRALEFLETNAAADQWMLQVECFDPHPPFFVPEKYRRLHEPQTYDGPWFDWPPYAPVAGDMSEEAIRHCRALYAALVSMCDHSLGRIMAAMDRHKLWDDTLLIVTTDHGFLLAEHGWWAFVKPPFYDTVARKPLWIWDPRIRQRGTRNDALTQTHDVPPTLLEYFGVQRPPDMQGIPLAQTLITGKSPREAALFGVFGGHVNCSDGRHVYMRAPVRPENDPLYHYTLMPTHMRGFFSRQEMEQATLARPFSFSKNMPLLRIPGRAMMADSHRDGHLLYDLVSDPEQRKPLHDERLEKRMRGHLIRLMHENDAPPEQFERLGLAKRV